MINLNLIPHDKKNLLKQGRLLSALREAALLVILFTAFFGILLWLSRYFLVWELADIAVRNSSSIDPQSQSSQQVNGLNKKIDAAAVLTDNYFPLRLVTDKIAATIPENISLTSLKFLYQNSTVLIEGTAKTREDLAAFKNSLSGYDWIISTDMPIDDFIDRTNNKFSATLSIDRQKLIKP